MRTKKLFKFQPADKYLISNLAQRKLWFSSPMNLNDPFEFKIGEIRDEDLKLLEKTGQIKLGRSRSVQDIKRMLKAEIQNKIDGWGIACFTERKDNLLMWSHYADMHRGVCLEFSIDDDAWLAGILRTVQPEKGPKWKGGVHKVRYSKEIPIPDFSKGSVWGPNGIIKALLTKSIDWKYEQEWRCISTNGGRLHPYFGNLTGVIFGHRTSEEDKESIKSILKNEVKYYDSKLSESEFKVEIIPHFAEK